MKITNDPEILSIAEYVEKNIEITPEIGLILGSGLGAFAKEVENPVQLSTSEIPGYPRSTVEGHAGKLVAGKIHGVPVLVVQGRIHFYEGYPIYKVVTPVRVLAALGAKAMIVTNAAGGVGEQVKPGDLMAITDHINLMGVNPLVGQKWGFDTFPDMTRAYDPDLIAGLKKVALQNNIELKEGVLGGWMGPTYETAAEVRLLRLIGVSAACMSTIPEIIAAARLKLRAMGISCITNYATGLSDKALTHEEVTQTAALVENKFKKLLLNTIPEISNILNNE